MNVIITTFSSPFSFFCIEKDFGKNINFSINTETTNLRSNKAEMLGLNHGQYIAVMWNNKWTRGIVTMENQFLIWLTDYGIYLRPNENTVCVDLPAEYKKYPTKVFEASIHGVVPLDKVLTEECEIKNEITTSWNQGAIEKAQVLINQAHQLYFAPVALLSMKHNDIVLGDLYLDMPNLGMVNIVDELLLWPVFLEKNKEVYIKYLSTFYTKRRKHHACLLKPVPNVELATISLDVKLAEYSSICAKVASFKLELEVKSSSSSADGSTVVTVTSEKEENALKLICDVIKNYSNMSIKIHDRKYNALNILLNKIRDLNICEKYHDLKSAGRATSRKHDIT